MLLTSNGKTMNKSIQYRNAENGDISLIIDLLDRNSLPTSDIGNGNIEFIVAAIEEKIIGCVGLERFGYEALLRSFAVDKNFRNNKIGSNLLERLFLLSEQRNIKTLHLLTTAAEKYFFSKGFSISSREGAPPSIKSTLEFTSLCPASSAYMVRIKNSLSETF